MAFYIELNKIKDEDEFVYYEYAFSLTTEIVANAAGKLRGKSKIVGGKIRINKETGDVDIIHHAEGDNGMYVQRAIWAILKHWKQGDFPDKTFWES